MDTTRCPRRSQKGFSLVELLVVVAIVAILGGLAMSMMSKTSTDAKVKSEVNEMFAEFKLRQEQYFLENNTYLSTGTSETDTYPTNPTAPGNQQAVTPPATWTTLRMNPGRTTVSCTYVSIAGVANSTTGIGTVASTEFGLSAAPPTNWYYVLAKCDADGDGSDYSYYFARSDIDGTAAVDKGQ